MEEYVRHMLQVLRLDGRVYQDLSGSNMALWYCLFNIAVIGLIYFLSIVYFGDILIETVPIVVIFVGVMVVSMVFLMHGGVTLLVWAFCRGLGGEGVPLLFQLYFNIGIAGISLWFLVPALAVIQTGLGTTAIYAYTVVVGVYSFLVVVKGISHASKLSNLKLAAVMGATAIYIGGFLYLWLFVL